MHISKLFSTFAANISRSMKAKLLSRINLLLVMLLTAMGFSCFVSCSAAYGPPLSSYKPFKPVIDEEAGTVNGVPYDNKTESCWKVTTTIAYTDNTVTKIVYFWGTQFALVASLEEEMYMYASAGYRPQYNYILASNFKDSESCLANNEND